MTHIDSRKLTRWYDFQAPFYAAWRNDLDGPLVREVVSAVAERPPSSLLDVGCGAGLFAVPLAARLAEARVAGADLSAGMLAVARGQARRRGLANLSLLRADATALPFATGAYDAVVMAGLLPNVNDRERVLAEAARVLSPGGRLFLVEYDRTTMGLAAKVLFRVMILGYKTVSFVFRRFRFAEGWNLRASTVDPDGLPAGLRRAGLQPLSTRSSSGHLVIESGKGEPAV